MNTKKSNIVLPAEWHAQSAVQLTWPHEGTDWAYMLDEVKRCFVAIAREVVKREQLIVVCSDVESVKRDLGCIDLSHIRFCPMETNDTWARDHGGISVLKEGQPVVFDFVFNGWGMKFAAGLDNLITRRMFQQKVFDEKVSLESRLPFVLEGGSIDSDGEGTLLTTTSCLLSDNRNEYLKRAEIEMYLKEAFGLRRLLWLEHGYLAGDDTDGHVDTLARFCNPSTIAYVKCTDSSLEEYESLKRMEEELCSFRQIGGEPYTLIPLPMADKVEEEGRRLPATYANFLILNGAVLLPFYGSEKDEIARAALQSVFTDREVIGVDCRPLIRQNGSLHCVTMQYPDSFV